MESHKKKSNGLVNHKEIDEINSKILEITLKIKDKYPELSKYIEEMPVTIPDEIKPKINIKTLESYYASLFSMLNKYILEQPENKKEKE